MSDSELLVAVLARFARLLPAAHEMPHILEQLMRSAIDVLEPAGATVALSEQLGAGEPGPFSGIPAELLDLEVCQRECARGPGVVAHTCGAPVTITDIGNYGDMWPEYADLAGQHRISSIAAIPMRLDDTEAGVLSLYSRQPRRWSGRDLSVAALLAGMATGHIVTANLVQRQQRVTEQLQHALNSRIVVEQAKGVIAHARQTTPDAAFELIRAHARRNRVTVRAVARGIVELGLRI
ncbi:GAF and ANTAR domain-containing protein [Nocardia sp. 2]|uniref:GAF and ANTAR domain-containing protein n=1 Tax=Nocardia acididurans TaxID=2802282 RepID=A0ABS1M3P3_9NOCA|nr:GAF and ANTAR domain-containing protein [Nocardia acididurans]MBL1074800.1 GAF and ANTAR domain-containing protein [Nocardia acididurans]